MDLSLSPDRGADLSGAIHLVAHLPQHHRNIRRKAETRDRRIRAVWRRSNIRRIGCLLLGLRSLEAKTDRALQLNAVSFDAPCEAAVSRFEINGAAVNVPIHDRSRDVTATSETRSHAFHRAGEAAAFLPKRVD